MIKAVWDCETYQNYFSVGFKWKNERKEFEISDWKDDRLELIEFARKVNYLVGFNSVNFDSVLLEYIRQKAKTAYEIWEMAQYIIYHDNEETREEMYERRQLDLFGEERKFLSVYKGDNFSKFKKYRYHNWRDVDLFLYWSKLARQSRKISLKSLACHMGWHWIQELPFDPLHIVKKEERDEIALYRKNDEDITEKLMYELSDQIEFRRKVEKTEGIKCLSIDDVKLGEIYLFNGLSKKLGVPSDDLKKHKTFRTTFNPREFLPNFRFETKECSDFYTHLVSKEFKRGDISHSIRFKNPDGSILIFDLGEGGGHGIGTHKIVDSKVLGKRIIDEDVTSLYPQLGIEWQFMPAHLPKEVGEILKTMKKERLSLPKGSTESNLRKLSMNGSIGNFKNPYSPLYDPQANLAICLTGQLAMLRAVELSIARGNSVIAVNTDGFTVLTDDLQSHQEVVDIVSREFKVEFERAEYEKIWFRDINNYIALKSDGKTKKKGLFVTDPPIDMSHDLLIIPKALEAFLIYGTPVDQFIRSQTDILDFCKSPKISKNYKVYWKGEKVQNLNRFYPSTKGAFLYKKKNKGQRNLEYTFKETTVELLNKHDSSLPFSSYSVDVDYFVNKVEDILVKLNVKTNNQLSLF